MKVLVLCTWWDGGPDIEYYAHKVLDENFNEVEIPDVEYPLVVDLLSEESVDVPTEVCWCEWGTHISERQRPYASQEMLDDTNKLEAAWALWHAHLDKCEDEFGDGWRDDDMPNYHKAEAEENERLWQVATDMREELKLKYEQAEPIIYNVHRIGVNEFCKMHGIEKVIRLH